MQFFFPCYNALHLKNSPTPFPATPAFYIIIHFFLHRHFTPQKHRALEEEMTRLRVHAQETLERHVNSAFLTLTKGMTTSRSGPEETLLGNTIPGTVNRSFIPR